MGFLMNSRLVFHQRQAYPWLYVGCGLDGRDDQVDALRLEEPDRWLFGPKQRSAERRRDTALA